MKFTSLPIFLIACTSGFVIAGAQAPPTTATTDVAVSPVPPPTPATQPLSNTRYATRTLRITWHGLAPDDSLFYSEALGDVVDNLMPSVVGGPPDKAASVQVNPIVRPNSIDLAFTIFVADDARHAARELADQAIAAIEDQARDRFQRQLQEELRPRRDAADEAEARVRDAENEAAKLREEMRDLAGRADISDKTITDALTRLEEEKQKLELDQMAKTARREALEVQIAKESDKIQKKIDSDPIAAELQKVVEAREQKADFASKQAGSGIVSMGEAREAVAQLAEAKAKLLERKRDAAAEAGGDALASLNKELLTLAVDQRELEARLKFVQERLPHLRGAMDRLDSYERAEGAVKAARNEYETARQDLHAFAHQGQTLRPPTFEVLQSTDRATPPDQRGLFGGGGSGVGGGGGGGGGQ